MVRPRLKYAALLLLLGSTWLVQAESGIASPRQGNIARSSVLVTAHLVDTAAIATAGRSVLATTALVYTLPPEPKPTTHWPWWLRILAVIFVLVFIRIVAGSVRSKPSGPGPV
jgi:hypothetical protein